MATKNPGQPSRNRNLLYLFLGVSTFCITGFYFGIGIPALLLAFIPPLGLKVVSDIANDEVNAKIQHYYDRSINLFKNWTNTTVKFAKNIFNSMSSAVSSFFDFNSVKKSSEAAENSLKKTEDIIQRVETMEREIAEVNQENTKQHKRLVELTTKLEENETYIKNNISDTREEINKLSDKIDKLEKLLKESMNTIKAKKAGHHSNVATSSNLYSRKANAVETNENINTNAITASVGTPSSRAC